VKRKFTTIRTNAKALAQAKASIKTSTKALASVNAKALAQAKKNIAVKSANVVLAAVKSAMRVVSLKNKMKKNTELFSLKQSLLTEQEAQALSQYGGKILKIQVQKLNSGLAAALAGFSGKKLSIQTPKLGLATVTALAQYTGGKSKKGKTGTLVIKVRKIDSSVIAGFRGFRGSRLIIKYETGDRSEIETALSGLRSELVLRQEVF